ncbi:hypothetical protein N0B31_19125 [Salinirubellus salinus]|uniref:Uncharacterized protein n=1 Tax=Salinirubellus salinus TaxID=1364945 RepID=A0A9E7R1V4_9EURY|nr:hypothetical protein [Salinirubellus salinus]UWM54216.1 hypothetical protein N0B31_19125 [Salinirubellus salinus]
MELTVFEIHLDDVALALSGGEREAIASTEPVTPEPEPSRTGVPRAVLALVPVFVALGVAAGFLAARRFGADRPPAVDETSVDVELTTEAQ